jgi:hypothetical protein
MKALKKRSKGQAKKLGRRAGHAVGSYLGNPSVGRSVGGYVGDQFARVTGFGDYEVRSNTLVAPQVVPDFGPNSVRITHKEYLGNIDGSVAFKGRAYPLNPGVSTTFPWLAGIARNYQQYRFNGVLFQYVSTSAFALGTTNSALGKVMLATNYNAEDPPFTSTVGMLATQFSNYCRPADSIMHAIECAPTETASNVYYVRTDLDGDQKDLRLTDIGFTEVAVEGMQSTTEVGGLWITYDITLMKPILNPQNAMSDGFDQAVIVTEQDSFYNGKVSYRNNTLGGTVALMDPTSYSYTWDPSVSSGFFLHVVELDPSATSTVVHLNSPALFSVFTNCKLVVDDDKNGPFNGAQIGQLSGVLAPMLDDAKYTNVQCPIVQLVQVTGPEPSMTLTNIELFGVGLTWRWSVFPVSYSPTPQNPDAGS